MMDSGRQALRWSIPGFIFTLEVYVLHAVWQAILGRDPFAAIPTTNPTSALAVVFAGVPIGFLLYQLYYRNYRPLGHSMMLVFRHPLAGIRGRYGVYGKWTFVRRDRGAEILSTYYRREGTREFVRQAWSGEDHLADELDDVTQHRRILGRFGPASMHVLELSKSLHDDCTTDRPIACDGCRRRYQQRFLFNWGVVIAMIDYASNTTAGGSIRSEYAAGSDVYHALGAARTAIATAAIAVLGYNLLPPETPLIQNALPAIVIATLAYAQYQVLHSTRESASTRLIIRTAASLAWYSRLPASTTASTPLAPGN